METQPLPLLLLFVLSCPVAFLVIKDFLKTWEGCSPGWRFMNYVVIALYVGFGIASVKGIFFPSEVKSFDWNLLWADFFGEMTAYTLVWGTFVAYVIHQWKKKRNISPKQKRYAQEAQHAAIHRKTQLEVDLQRKKLAQVQGGAPQKVLVAELELDEKESMLRLFEEGASMTQEEREEYQARLDALRKQIKKEKRLL